jgi:DNA polymerase IV
MVFPMPERHVLLIDMNAFFAAIEQQCNPHLQGKPVLVCGNPTSRTIVTTASYEARPFGVKSGMPLGEALRLCPNAVLIEGEPAKYVDTARRLQEMLIQYSPKVEVFSIDEAFVELAPDEDPVAVARAFKVQLKNETGLTCSVGIGPNKLVAKLAAGMRKPNGLVWIKQASIPRVFERMPVAELCGIGPKIEKRLHAIGIKTLGQLGRTSLDVLQGYFGTFWGRQLLDMGRGIDESLVVSCFWQPVIKSMGHSYTLHRDTVDMDEIRAHLLRLSLMVGRRLRAERCAGKTIRLTVRAYDFSTSCRHQTFPRWFRHGRDIYDAAFSIFEGLPWPGPVRMIGVAVANLVKGASQRELFRDNEKVQALEEAEDALLNRFGEFVIKPATLLLLNQKRKDAEAKRAGEKPKQDKKDSRRDEGKWAFTSEPAASRSLPGARRFILTR